MRWTNWFVGDWGNGSSFRFSVYYYSGPNQLRASFGGFLFWVCCSPFLLYCTRRRGFWYWLVFFCVAFPCAKFFFVQFHIRLSVFNQIRVKEWLPILFFSPVREQHQNPFVYERFFSCVDSVCFLFPRQLCGVCGAAVTRWSVSMSMYGWLRALVCVVVPVISSIHCVWCWRMSESEFKCGSPRIRCAYIFRLIWLLAINWMGLSKCNQSQSIENSSKLLTDKWCAYHNTFDNCNFFSTILLHHENLYRLLGSMLFTCTHTRHRQHHVNWFFFVVVFVNLLPFFSSPTCDHPLAATISWYLSSAKAKDQISTSM